MRNCPLELMETFGFGSLKSLRLKSFRLKSKKKATPREMALQD
jgi:hypothetical protein